jgi:hypothetical protein
MVKEKADKVHVHRIEFQQKERQLLETTMTAYSINAIMTPLVALMSDISGMLVFAGLLTYIGIQVDVDGIDEDSGMGVLVTRIQDAFKLSNESKNLQSIPSDFIQEFFIGLMNQDWRFDLDPRAD